MPIAEQTWPTFLPLPQLAGASFQTFNTHVDYETIDGPPIRFQEWNLKPTEYACILLCENSGDWYNFEALYKTNTRYGNAWFNVKLAIAGGMRNCLCAFSGGYTVAQTGVVVITPARYFQAYRISFNLLVYQPEKNRHPWL